MAFSSTVDVMNVSGGRRMTAGTWTNAAGDTGGTINTGLKHCNIFVWSNNSHIGGEVVKVSKNPSGSPGSVTIVTSDGIDADWFAFGL